MRITLMLPRPLVERLRAHALANGTSMSGVVAEALLQFFEEHKPVPGPYRLPKFAMGPLLVDVADREALHDLLDQER